jgi:hypothetical protein
VTVESWAGLVSSPLLNGYKGRRQYVLSVLDGIDSGSRGGLPEQSRNSGSDGRQQMKAQKPRSANFYGMHSEPQMLKNDTWLEPEEITYPSGAMVRRARALNVETGKLKIVRCGISDTAFSIPVRGGGWLGMEDGVLQFHPLKKN